MTTGFQISHKGLNQFRELRQQAVDAVITRFQASHAADYARFGEAGRKACRTDIEYHLDFLRPVIELGSLEPYVDYLHWLVEVLDARHVPTDHIGQSLAWLGEFFMVHIAGRDGTTIVEALATAWSRVRRGHAAIVVDDPQASPLSKHLAPFATALLAGEHRAAQAMVSTLAGQGVPLPQIYVHLIQAALHAIGDRWLRNEISVAQEHLATATAMTVMAEAFSATAIAPPNGRRALFSCVEGNRHYVGLRMVADMHEMQGWQVQFLGPDTPTRALVAQIGAWRPDRVGLSIAFPHQLAVAREAIAAIRALPGPQTQEIIVGGTAINRYGRLARFLGADGHASSAIAAVQPIGLHPECRS